MYNLSPSSLDKQIVPQQCTFIGYLIKCKYCRIGRSALDEGIDYKNTNIPPVFCVKCWQPFKSLPVYSANH